MPNFNQVILIGHMTRDPELTTIPSGTPMCKFGIAHNHKFKDKSETSFFDCVAWGKTADTIAEYHKKGDAIMVVGRLKQENWQATDGQKRSKVGIVVESFTFMPKGEKKAPQATDTKPPDDDLRF